MCPPGTQPDEVSVISLILTARAAPIFRAPATGNKKRGGAVIQESRAAPDLRGSRLASRGRSVQLCPLADEKRRGRGGRRPRCLRARAALLAVVAWGRRARVVADHRPQHLVRPVLSQGRLGAAPGRQRNGGRTVRRRS